MIEQNFIIAPYRQQLEIFDEAISYIIFDQGIMGHTLL